MRLVRSQSIGGPGRWPGRSRKRGSSMRVVRLLLALSPLLLAAACGGGNGNGGTGGTGGSGGTGGAGGVPCGLAAGVEPEPNETRDTPSTLAFGAAVTACVADATDVDFYEVTAPA